MGDPFLSPPPSRTRLVMACILAFVLPWFLAGIAAAITPGGYWTKAATEAIFILLAVYLVARLVPAWAFQVISLGFGIPTGLMFFGIIVGYAHPRNGVHIRGALVLYWGGIWLAGLLLAHLLGKRWADQPIPTN